jgi:hypothetical protein
LQTTVDEETVMSHYKYIPSDFAKTAFNLTSSEYSGDGVTPLLEGALGKDNYDRYVVVQDPLTGGKTCGEIRIITNPRCLDPHGMQFQSIGSIQKLG